MDPLDAERRRSLGRITWIRLIVVKIAAWVLSPLQPRAAVRETGQATHCNYWSALKAVVGRYSFELEVEGQFIQVCD